jgi:hypothetical protein
MSMREQIAHILTSTAMSSSKAEIVADAILAALPDMIAPLVWEGNIAQNNMGGRYVIGWYDAGDLCTTLDFHGYGNPDTRQYIGGDTFVYDLKAAANTHHRAAIMAAFTGETQ